MNPTLRLLSLTTLFLSSFFLFKINGIYEVFLIFLLVASFYIFLSNRIVKVGMFDKNILKIFSIFYVLSFFLIIWITVSSIQIGGVNTPSLPGDSLGYFLLGKELLVSDIASSVTPTPSPSSSK